MHSMIVIQHLILPWKPFDTLAITPRIWTIETFHPSLVGSHMAIEIAMAASGFIASWVLTAIAAGGYVAWVGAMSVLLDGSLDLVWGILDTWALWSNDPHVGVLREMTLRIGSRSDGVMAACKRKT